MPSEKLAAVFSPCLFQTRGRTPQEAAVVNDLIRNYIRLFSVGSKPPPASVASVPRANGSRFAPGTLAFVRANVIFLPRWTGAGPALRLEGCPMLALSVASRVPLVPSSLPPTSRWRR